MKSAKFKQAENIEVKDLIKLNIFISVAFTLGCIFLNFMLSYSKEVYHSIAPILVAITIPLNIISIILSFNKKTIYMSGYILIPMQGILVFLSLYLNAANCLTPESIITKIIIFANYILVSLYIFFKRIIVKNEDYISSVKKGTHGTYVKRDLIASLILTAILLTIAKVIDSSPIIIKKGKSDKFTTGLYLIGGAICFSITYITAIANYLYNVKDKKSPKGY